MKKRILSVAMVFLVVLSASSIFVPGRTFATPSDGFWHYYVTKSFASFPGNNWVNAVRIAAHTSTTVYVDTDCDDVADYEISMDAGDNWEADLPTGTHIWCSKEVTIHQYDDYYADWEMVLLQPVCSWSTDYFYGGLWTFGLGTTHILIQAAYDATNVAIDFDCDGVPEETNTIDHKEVWDYSMAQVWSGEEISWGSNSGLDTRAGAHITSDKPIQVHVFGEHTALFGSAYNILPTSGLGKEYFVPRIDTHPNRPDTTWDAGDKILLVATEPGTVVEIDKDHDCVVDETITLDAPCDSDYWPKGRTDDGWLNGAYIKSNKKVAVFISSPGGGHQWDGWASQLVPKEGALQHYWNTVSWSTIKYTTDLSTGVWPGAPEIYIFAYKNGTTVNIDQDNDGVEDVTYSLDFKDGGVVYTPEKCGEHIWTTNPAKPIVVYQDWYVDAGDSFSPLGYKTIISVYVDTKPGSWPNPFNQKSTGVLPVAICGTEDFDVTTIDPETIRLTREGVEEGVAPLRWSYEDVATPYKGEPGGGHDLEGDGYLDLVLHFDTQEVYETLGLDAFKRETIPLIITGKLKEEHDGTQIRGEDYVWILDVCSPRSR